MSVKENLLNNSSSFKYYKENYENSLNEIDQLKKIIKTKDDEIKDLSQKLDKEKKQVKELNKNLKRVRDAIINLRNNMFTKFREENLKINELNYAFLFNDTIKNSDWLKQKNFSLNNAASNYSFMYTLFRVLDEVKPKNILELGLGQTSKLTTQFVDYFSDSNLIIVEGDQNWIDHFSNSLNLNKNVEIVQRNLETFNHNGTENLRYANLNDVVKDDKFDLIIIDGPQGFIMDPEPRELVYSRANIWNILDNLSQDFIIIMDDYNRDGEKNTMKHVEDLLTEKGITYYTFKSNGLKEQFVICSEKYQFVSWF